MELNISKQIVLKHLGDYIDKMNIPHKHSGKITTLSCPFCEDKNSMTATKLDHLDFIRCRKCDAKYNIIDIARKLENLSGEEDDIIHHLKEKLDLTVITVKDEEEINKILTFYKENDFDLVPVVKGGKRPIEKAWTTQEHKDIEEWKRWIKDGLNLGLKTGKISNVTIIDIDQKPIPDEIKELLGDTLVQESSNGYHYIYQYQSELPKTRIDELKVDLENDGGQVVVYPSEIAGVQRQILNLKSPSKMPDKLKEYLKNKITVPRKTASEELIEDIATEKFKLGVLGEGQRNSSLIRLGGILRKSLNRQNTEQILHVLNKTLCDRPLEYNEIRAMVNSLDKYSVFDEQELAHKILEYLKDVEEANRNEIAMAIAGTNRGEEKKRIDKALNYLVKEEYILKRGSKYIIIKKANWQESLVAQGKPIDFKMPYFYDVANFNKGDLILIGSKNKFGKTHLSLNIIQQLVRQGITPYYISLEPGSRFAKIALQLGMKEGDFKWTFLTDPTQIEVEKNSITIIDWLCPKDFKNTDKLFLQFIEQLHKTNGILIIFMQLKDSGEWFAPNMVKQFPAMACKYLYEEDNTGEYGKFFIEVIREPKIQTKIYEVPCRYNWETKELKRIDELEENKGV